MASFTHRLTPKHGACYPLYGSIPLHIKDLGVLALKGTIMAPDMHIGAQQDRQGGTDVEIRIGSLRLPIDLYDWIKAQAKQEQRSSTKQIVYLLLQAMNQQVLKGK